MVNSQHIYKKAKKVMKNVYSRQPILLANELGITIVHSPNLGNTNVKGFFTIIRKIPTIIISDSLDEVMERVVIAHEIGHSVLHRKLGKQQGLQEFELFSLKNEIEYEANVFAAHVLIDEDELLEYLHMNYTIEAIAKITETHESIVLIKIKEMIALGHDLQLCMDLKKHFLR